MNLNQPPNLNESKKGSDSSLSVSVAPGAIKVNRKSDNVSEFQKSNQSVQSHFKKRSFTVQTGSKPFAEEFKQETQKPPNNKSTSTNTKKKLVVGGKEVRKGVEENETSFVVAVKASLDRTEENLSFASNWPPFTSEEVGGELKVRELATEDHLHFSLYDSNKQLVGAGWSLSLLQTKDSSRYFVLDVVGEHSCIGFSFFEKSDAFRFNNLLQKKQILSSSSSSHKEEKQIFFSENLGEEVLLKSGHLEPSKKDPISNSSTSFISLNLENDPELKRFLSIASHMLNEFPTVSTKVRSLALMVSSQMGGNSLSLTPKEREKLVEECIYNLRQSLRSNVIPIGLITNGNKYHRALLL